jgi:predicted glycoside hydrolase/deacetylase ChbG (UPF0249 family)
MTQAVWLVADDYGLSPGVGRGIRRLLDSGRLSGTGCMTLFPEWPGEAALLKDRSTPANAAIGIHLTLTDFAPLTGTSALAPHGTLPPLGQLIRRSLRPDAAFTAAVHAELDAQLAAFESAMGHAPHYLDGHQHVHFLAPVRSWLLSRRAHFAALGRENWLRGAPSLALAPGLGMRAKVALVALLARGFDRAMAGAGYVVHGPLAGFYDWKDAARFPDVIAALSGRAAAGCVVMCHPGEVDAVLAARDGLTQAREMELATLAAGAPFVIR